MQRYLVYSIFFLISSVGLAQRAQIGLRTGPGIAAFHGLENGDTDFRFNPSIGMVFKFDNNKRNKYSFQTELYYTKKGAKTYYNIANYYHGNIRFNLHYLEAPLIFNYHVNRRFKLETGVYGSILLNSDFDYNGTFYYGYGSVNNDDLNQFDYGLVLGAGIRIPRGTLSFRYQYGLNNIVKNEEIYPYLAGAKNQVFSLAITRFF